MGIGYKSKRRESARQVFLGPKSFHSSRMKNEGEGVANQKSEETNCSITEGLDEPFFGPYL